MKKTTKQIILSAAAQLSTQPEDVKRVYSHITVNGDRCFCGLGALVNAINSNAHGMPSMLDLGEKQRLYRARTRVENMLQVNLDQAQHISLPAWQDRSNITRHDVARLMRQSVGLLEETSNG